MEELERARKARGLSQERLAKAIGVSQPHLSKIENGKAKPSEAVADEIRRWLKANKAPKLSTDAKRAHELARLIELHSRELAALVGPRLKRV